MLLLEITVYLVFQTVGKHDKNFPSSSVSPVPEQANLTCEQHAWREHVIKKAGNEYILWTPSSNISAPTGIWYRTYLHTRTSEYLRNCPCLCPPSSLRQRTGYNLLHPLLLPEYGNPPPIMDYVHSTTAQKIQTWAVGIFWTVWLCLTYPRYWRHMQLNCHIHHFPHICQQQPCLPQSGTAASWSHPALRDMNLLSEAGCLLKTPRGAKIKIQNKALISAAN